MIGKGEQRLVLWLYKEMNRDTKGREKIIKKQHYAVSRILLSGYYSDVKIYEVLRKMEKHNLIESTIFKGFKIPEEWSGYQRKKFAKSERGIIREKDGKIITYDFRTRHNKKLISLTDGGIKLAKALIKCGFE